MALIAKHVIIQGRVQGVGYRSWTYGNAKKRGLVGWVKNLADGTVEAVFQGEADAVNAMVESCWKGPLASKVREIVVMDKEPDMRRQVFERFATK